MGFGKSLTAGNLDNEPKLEALLGAINVIISTEIDSEAKIEALAGAINLLVSTEMDSEAEIEALASIAMIVESEIDSEAEVEAIMGAVNMIVATEISNEAQLEALVGSLNIILDSEIDTEAKLESLTSTLIATEAEVAGLISTHASNASAHHTKYTDAEAIAAAKTDPKFADDVFALQDNADATKQMVASLGGATTAKTVTLASSHTDDRIITLPDATGTLALTSELHTRLHNIDDASDHGVGSIAANYFPMNIGGSVVSSSGQLAKANAFEGAVYARAGTGAANSSYMYGSLAASGLGAGGMVYSTTDGPLKFVQFGGSSSAGAVACAIVYDANLAGIDDEMIISSTGWTDNGDTFHHRCDVMDLSMSLPAEATGSLPPVADHGNEIAIATDGDDSGPALVVCDGALWRPTILVPKAPYAIDGGSLYRSGTSYREGFHEPNDNTVHADWVQNAAPAGSTIAKTNGSINIVVPAAVASDWTLGSYTAARCEMPMPSNRRWEAWTHATRTAPGATCGSFLGVLFEDNDQQFVSIMRLEQAGPNHNILASHGPNVTDTTVVGGGQNGWMKISFDGSNVTTWYNNNAVGAEPGDEDWTYVRMYTPVLSSWNPVAFRLVIAAISVTPGVTVNFFRPKWRII